MSLSRAAVAAAAVLFSAGSASADEFWVYFGTYTAKDGGKGIYRSRFSPATGKLSEPELAAEMLSPAGRLSRSRSTRRPGR
jgi:6-phosphogluconolactonase